MKRLFLLLATVASAALAAEGPAEATVSVSGTSAVSGRLSSGYKSVVCTVPAHYRLTRSAGTAITTDAPINAHAPYTFMAGNGASYAAFITDGQAGTCTIYQRNVPLNLPFPAPAVSAPPTPTFGDWTDYTISCTGDSCAIADPTAAGTGVSLSGVVAVELKLTAPEGDTIASGNISRWQCSCVGTPACRLVMEGDPGSESTRSIAYSGRSVSFAPISLPARYPDCDRVYFSSTVTTTGDPASITMSIRVAK